MQSNEIFEAICSRNGTFVYGALWAICRCVDTNVLDFLNGRKEELIVHIKNTQDFKHKDLVRRALRTLENHKLGDCRCNLYMPGSRIDPNTEQESGVIKIHKHEFDTKAYEDHFYVECLGCKKKFEVTQENGYHYPFWKWNDA